MLDKTDNYMEETKPLFRLLRTEAFRFIIVRYNHYSLVTRLKEDLLQCFPERPQNAIDARNADYRLLVDSYYKAERGFFFVENFDEILANSEIYSGLNQRRDKLAMYPIALIVFLSSSTNELYARQIMGKMPDLWSFRSLMLDLKIEDIQVTPIVEWRQNLDIEQLDPYMQVAQTESDYKGIKDRQSENVDYILVGKTAKEKELDSLIARVNSVANNEINLQRSAYEQIAKLFVDLWRFDEAIEYYLKLERIKIELKDQVGLGTVYNDIGFIYSQKRDFKKSLEYYKKSEEIRSKEGNETALGTTYNNIGGVYSEIGDWEMAYNYYLNAEQIFLTSNQDEGLAATYNNIGGYFIHNNDWEKALSFLLKSEERRLKCGDRLGLGTTYFNLGFVHSKLKDLSKALEFYLKSEMLLLEFGNTEMLKILYRNIAEIFIGIDARSKAIDFYQKLVEIEQKSGNKIGVGNALNYMGIVTSDMGDFNKALVFHRQAERIRYEIGDNSGLIQTLYNIGMEWLRIKNTEKAVDYFTLAGYIAKKNMMTSELQKMDWAIRELIKKHGSKGFMKLGKKLYKSWLEHSEQERKNSK